MQKMTLSLLTAITLSVSACSTSSVNVPANETIYFNHNSDIVSPMGIEKIKYFTDINKKHKNTNGYIFYIEGHTNDLGSEPYNMNLSVRRAEAIKRVMVQNGIAPWRISTVGYGKKHPLPFQGKRGMRLNRRATIGFRPSEYK